MPTDPEPPELARLLDFAERPRIGDWSFRAALVRYALPEPVRVGAIVETIRRLEWALHRDPKVFERDGPTLWASLDGAGEGDAPASPDGRLVALLAVARRLDDLGDVVAGWAMAPAAPRPNDEVDRTMADVVARLDALGVPREDQDARPRPPRGARARG
jgi:hypothetical protein